MAEVRVPIEETVESLDRPSMTLVGSARSTGGALELVEDRRDEAGGPPPHVHDEHDEAFYILDGRFTVTRDTSEVSAGPGEFVFIPRGTRHAYRSEQDGSRLLFIVLPAGLSGFLRAQGQLVASGMDVREAMALLSRSYDTRPVD